MSGNLHGILSIVGAMFVITLQDSMVKQFNTHYALHEVMLVRAAVALLFTLVFVRLEGGFRQLRTRNFPYLLLRGLLLVIANTCFFLGQAAMPLAEVVAIFFVAPLLITSLSALLLGEPVGPRRWFGVGIGLLGVIIIMRPGDGVLRWASFLPLVAAFAYAFMQLMARRMGRLETAGTMVVYMQFVLLTVSGLFGLTVGGGQFATLDHVSLSFLLRAWSTPSLEHVGLWCMMGALSAVGGYFMTQGYRVANAAVVAPFEYVAIPCSLFWGYSIYNEVPDLTTFLGISLIIAGGLYVIHRELQLLRSEKASAE